MTTWTIGTASRRGTRTWYCDSTATHTSGDGTVAAAVIDGTGNSPELADLAVVLGEVAVRMGTRRGGLAGLVTAGDLLAGEEAAAVMAIAPDEGPVVISWIGDCRGYHWDGDQLRQITTDHTMGQQLRASGGCPWEVAESHDHWLMCGLSAATAATVRQVWVVDHDQEPAPGDLVILTSDGVHDQVSPERMLALVTSFAEGRGARGDGDPQTLAAALVSAAQADEDGYRDDATAVVMLAG